MEDSRIIELFYERSEQAISELSEKYGKLCFKTAENILGNRHDAEECVNEAYLGCWNTIPPEKPTPLVSYVCKIVRNRAMARYRKNIAAKRNSIYDTALSELEECIPCPDNAETEFNAKATAEIIDKFLLSASKRDRVMFVRRYFYGDSISDIASLFGVTDHYVSVRLSRTRKKLKDKLLKEGVVI